MSINKCFRRRTIEGLIFLCLALHFVTSVNAQDAGSPPIIISMKAVAGLQYDVARFKVKPGSKVEIILANVSDMPHNLLITKPGARMDVVNSALQLAEKAPQMDYIPKTDAVLWSIPILSPGQTKSVTFTAPAKAGVYPYVCTYPGHGFLMYGAMYVTPDETLPDIASDINIPESQRVDTTGKQESESEHKKNTHPGNPSGVSPHPYSLIPPYLYHVFMEGVGPAAIAVNLPNDLSYCWDAGACRLRIAWKGGFVDMTDLWKGHFDASAKILGDIFFRDNTEYPIRLGDNAAIPTVKYMGYKLINKYPEFHYTLNGIDVYEVIRPKQDSSGLIRVFRIPNANSKVWFFANGQDDAIEYKASTGKWEDRKLQLSPVEAKEFTLTMTSYFIAYKNKNK